MTTRISPPSDHREPKCKAMLKAVGGANIGPASLRGILALIGCGLNSGIKTAMRAQRTIEVLEALVEWVEAKLDRFGVAHVRIRDECGRRSDGPERPERSSRGAHGRGPDRRTTVAYAAHGSDRLTRTFR